jgi:hypothetical protein
MDTNTLCSLIAQRIDPTYFQLWGLEVHWMSPDYDTPANRAIVEDVIKNYETLAAALPTGKPKTLDLTDLKAATTIADDDYFLLEASSTYTPSNSHYCACVAKIRYTYSTPDNPDHTITNGSAASPTSPTAVSMRPFNSVWMLQVPTDMLARLELIRHDCPE